jgi:hypothetical protein
MSGKDSGPYPLNKRSIAYYLSPCRSTIADNDLEIDTLAVLLGRKAGTGHMGVKVSQFPDCYD